MIALILALQSAAAAPAYKPGDVYWDTVRQCEAAVKSSGGGGSIDFMMKMRSICADRESIALRQEAGTLVSVGRCPDAVNLALQAGDFDLAQRTRTFCATAKP